MTINPQAGDLNAILDCENLAITALLSPKGKRAFFPKKGILAQAAEAGNCKINATIGIALEEDGTTAVLPSLSALTELEDKDAFQYAPSAGLPKLRETWKEMILKKNPSVVGKPISIPVVTCALTHGIYVAGQLFLDEDDAVITPDFYWGNYNLVLHEGTGATIKTYDTFDDTRGYNVAALQSAVEEGGVGKKVMILNFPNNPTGYTPTKTEAYEIVEMLVEQAEKGSHIAVIIDDAYFGLVFEEGIFKESLFALLADAHENILAIKVDGPTKEDYVWGYRTGFITYGIKGGNPDIYAALEAKTAGIVRGSISNAPRISQSLLLKAYLSKEYAAEKQVKFDLLKSRYDEVKRIIAAHPEYTEQFDTLPFNSGYFMCIKSNKGLASEDLRVALVKDKSIGLIQIGGLLRVAFSSTPTEQLEIIFEEIFDTCKTLSAKKK